MAAWPQYFDFAFEPPNHPARPSHAGDAPRRRPVLIWQAGERVSLTRAEPELPNAEFRIVSKG
jgi:hypothetical protein